MTRTYEAAGSFTVTVVAADAATNTTAASRTITIAPAPGIVTPAPAGAPIAQRVPAKISRLRMTPGRFRIATVRTNAKKGQQKRGTQITPSDRTIRAQSRF